MAVIHWPPQTVLYHASLRDIYEACGAWQRMNMTGTPDEKKPDKSFLQHMMQKFPDKPRERKTHDG